MKKKLKNNVAKRTSQRTDSFSFYIPGSKELAKKNIHFVVLSFKAEMFSFELHLAKFVKRYSMGKSFLRLF